MATWTTTGSEWDVRSTTNIANDTANSYSRNDNNVQHQFGSNAIPAGQKTYWEVECIGGILYTAFLVGVSINSGTNGDNNAAKTSPPNPLLYAALSYNGSVTNSGYAIFLLPGSPAPAVWSASGTRVGILYDDTVSPPQMGYYNGTGSLWQSQMFSLPNMTTAPIYPFVVTWQRTPGAALPARHAVLYGGSGAALAYTVPTGYATLDTPPVMTSIALSLTQP